MVTIRAKIRNLGTDPVSNAIVNIYTLESPINTINIPSIGPGGEYLVQTTWVVTDPNDFIYIEADPDNVLLEMDEFNNLAIASIVRNVRFTQINQILRTTYRAMGDLDNDGDLDVLNVNGSILLINDGNGNFTYLTNDKTGLNYGRDYSGAFGDIDNDGDLDIFLCSTWGENRLFRNNGNLTFTDITQQAGLKGINTYTVNAVFGDLNNDGHLDLFVGAYGGSHYIYLNNGNGTFTRVLPSFSEGVQNVELGDIDGDGDLDVVVCSGSAVIYKNDGTGRFTRHLALPGSYWDAGLGDIDNDGHLDIVTLNPGRVFYNDGQGNFSLSNSVALPRSGVYTISLADFDNDGDLDILYSDYGYLIRNDENRKFTDISFLNSLNLPWYTVLLGDIDNDGDIDIVGGQYIYKNQMNDNNYLIFSRRGIESNYYGIGSKIRVYEEGHLGEKNYLKRFRQVQAGGHGYVSMDSSDAHFGLNSNYLYDIQVEFPASGIVVNRRLTATGRKLILPEYGDLYVNTQDITFSPEAPVDGDNLIITAVIHNSTTVDVDKVVVGFYDGNPSAGGMELGRVELSYVPAEGEKVFPIQVALSEGVHEIYVVIDPDNTLRETNKGNNVAYRTVTVVPRLLEQDLSIKASDIGISPASPWEGAEVTISAIVHSSGSREIQNVPVTFYDGDPRQGGVFIGQNIIPTILANENAQTQVQWNTLGRSGLHYIHVLVDPQNLIRELNESNNSAFVAVEVTAPAKPDLAITSSNIAFSNLSPKEGKPLTISATVHNLGAATSGVDVFLYDGDPSQGGVILSQKAVPQIFPLGATVVLNFDVNTVGLAGNRHFFISIDPNNRIDEMIESNNIASNSLTIGSSNLNLSLSIDKSVYTSNEDVQTTVNLYNLINSSRMGTLQVKILDGNNNFVANVIGGQSLTLNPNESRSLTSIWNTGQTLAGSYKVYCLFGEDGNVISRAEAPITITPVKDISSRIAADKISYKANQIVTMASTITSLSPNYIFSNLNARIKITDSQAATLLTDSKTIPILTPNQLSTLKTYWNTSTNPAGIYAVILEVFEGVILLSTSTSTFEILGLQETGEGLTGTLSAQPNPVYQGGDETTTYTVTNQGNEDAANLNIKVLVVNPENQEIMQTLETTANLPMGATLAGNFVFSTIPLTPRTYLAILQVSSGTMTQSKTLASATFEVKPSIEITKTIPDVKNVLVWLNYSWGTGQSCPNRVLVEQALNESGIGYYIVLDKKDFQTELRNPSYTDFMILGNHHPIEDHFAEELREQVYSGKGVISSLFNRQDLNGDVFGIKSTRHLSGRDYPIELLNSEIAAQGVFQSNGRALRIAAIHPEENVGWIVEIKNNGTTKYPGLIKRQYGNGKVLFFAFDLGLSTQNYNSFSDLLKNSINYIHTPQENSTVFYPGQLVPVEIKLKSLGGAFDLIVTETYPAEVEIYNPSTGQWIADNPWLGNLHLEPDEAKTIFYYALVPDRADTYILQTEVGYMDNGTYHFYQSLSTEILVETNTTAMLSDIITALNTLPVSGQEMAKVNNAIGYMNNVQNRVINTEIDVEKNIGDILKAIDSILSITTFDISQIRLMMDRLLKFWEGRWHL